MAHQEQTSLAMRQQILKATLAKVRSGQPAQIFVPRGNVEFNNRITFYQAWVDEEELPCVTLIALQRNHPSASAEFLLLQTGPYEEYMEFYYTPGGDRRLQRALPGKSWDDLSGVAWASFDLPGCNRIGQSRFNDYLIEIEQGFYSIDRIIAVDGSTVDADPPST